MMQSGIDTLNNIIPDIIQLSFNILERAVNMDNGELMSINKMLKVIVALLLERKEETKNKLRDQIEILNNLGVKPPEIAAILNRSSIYVHKELSGIRKLKKGKKKP